MDSTPRSIWPRRIGILCIIFGVGGILQGIQQIAVTYMTGFLSQIMEKAETEAELPGSPIIEMDSFAATSAMAPSLRILGAFAIILGILLLVGGIFMFRRKRQTRPILFAWSGAKCLYAFIAMMISIKLQAMQMEEIERSIASAGAQMHPYTETIFMMIALFGLLWHLALPVFLIIWLLRKPVISDISSWDKQPTPEVA